MTIRGTAIRVNLQELNTWFKSNRKLSTKTRRWCYYSYIALTTSRFLQYTFKTPVSVE